MDATPPHPENGEAEVSRAEAHAAVRVAVVGAGGVGLGLGSCLVGAGARVLFIVRDGEAARGLQGHGLERSGVFGSAAFGPEQFAVETGLDAVPAWRADYVLVCTKTTARDEVANALASAYRSAGANPALPAIVLCLNGWGSAERFAAGLPQEHIFNARVITGFRRVAPWRVEITVHAEAIHIGSLFGADSARVLPLCRVIDAGGIPCVASQEIEKDLLAKLLYNCALNPIAALRGVPYGAIGEDEASRAVLEATVAEIFHVLAAVGKSTHWRDAADYLAFFYQALLPPTRLHESSMLQDLRAGRGTEIDALCGAVSALGRSAGVETPVNDALTVLIRAVGSAG